MIPQLQAWFDKLPGLGAGAQGRLVGSLLALFVLLLLRWLVLRVLHRSVEDPRVLYRWRKAVTYSTFFIGVLVIGRLWFPGLQGISTFLGLLSAGLAIALRDPIVNLAAWGFILWRRPFEVGDRIQIGSHAGDVIDVRIFQFTLMEIGNWVDADQSTGRIVHVPNGRVFVETTANYTKGFQHIWNELPVLVTFESNWEKAKGLLLEIANRRTEQMSSNAQQRLRTAARKYMIFYSKLTPTVYTSVKDSGVLLTIRYLTEPRRRRGTAQEIWEDVLHAFAACDDVDFAYPTQRFYHNVAEGKPGARAEPPAKGE